MKFNKMKFITNDQIENLIKIIEQIPGQKIVTLTTVDGLSSFIIDVDEKGNYGYKKEHIVLFMAKLVSAFYSGGAGLIIRQFLPIRTEQNIQLKTIYGICIGHGKCIPMSKAEVELAHTTNHKTGEKIPPEPDVMFADFPRINSI